LVVEPGVDEFGLIVNTKLFVSRGSEGFSPTKEGITPLEFFDGMTTDGEVASGAEHVSQFLGTALRPWGIELEDTRAALCLEVVNEPITWEKLMIGGLDDVSNEDAVECISEIVSLLNCSLRSEKDGDGLLADILDPIGENSSQILGWETK
jgi:hypothetical protein